MAVEIKKVSDLEGRLLDYWVAKADGWDVCIAEGQPESVSVSRQGQDTIARYSPSTKWVQGGPIIEREKITLVRLADTIHLWPTDAWIAFTQAHYIYDDFGGENEMMGQTALVAAMRCFVASRFGLEVMVET